MLLNQLKCTRTGFLKKTHRSRWRYKHSRFTKTTCAFCVYSTICMHISRLKWLHWCLPWFRVCSNAYSWARLSKR